MRHRYLALRSPLLRLSRQIMLQSGRTVIRQVPSKQMALAILLSTLAWLNTILPFSRSIKLWMSYLSWVPFMASLILLPLFWAIVMHDCVSTVDLSICCADHYLFIQGAWVRAQIKVGKRLQWVNLMHVWKSLYGSLSARLFIMVSQSVPRSASLQITAICRVLGQYVMSHSQFWNWFFRDHMSLELAHAGSR